MRLGRASVRGISDRAMNIPAVHVSFCKITIYWRIYTVWNITFTDTKLISDFYTNIYKRVSQGNKSLIIRKQWSCCNIFNIFLTMYNMYTLCGYFAFPIFTECHLNTYFSVGFSGVQDQNPVSWMRILKLKKNSGRKVWREPKFGELDPVFPVALSEILVSLKVAAFDFWNLDTNRGVKRQQLDGWSILSKTSDECKKDFEQRVAACWVVGG